MFLSGKLSGNLDSIAWIDNLTDKGTVTRVCLTISNLEILCKSDYCLKNLSVLVLISKL